jgi:hypothetical protein
MHESSHQSMSLTWGKVLLKNPVNDLIPHCECSVYFLEKWLIKEPKEKMSLLQTQDTACLQRF